MSKTVCFVDDKLRWDNFVTSHPEFALMQSWEWGEFKKELGWKVLRYGVEQNGKLVAGAQVKVKYFGFNLIGVAYIARGPIMNWQDEETARMLFDAIHAKMRRKHIIFLKIEPALDWSPETVQTLRNFGFRESRFRNQPQCTTIIDLRPEETTILARMHKSNRKNIKRSQRDGIVIRMGDESDLPIALDLLKHTAERKHFSEQSLDYYQKEWKLLSRSGNYKIHLAEYSRKVIAMSMDVIFGDRCFALHSGSLDEFNHLKANDLLIWHVIQWAKLKGCVAYDLWGVPDEIGDYMKRGEEIPIERKDGLWGVYYFKRGFGGTLSNYVGAWDFVYSNLFFRFMEMALRLIGSHENMIRLGGLFNRNDEIH